MQVKGNEESLWIDWLGLCQGGWSGQFAKQRELREAKRVADKMVAFLLVLWRDKFSQQLNLAFIHPNFLILSLVKYNKHIPTILSKFAKVVTLSYGPHCYDFEPPWLCRAVIFVEYLKIIPWMF